jgi:hypothetical protein
MTAEAFYRKLLGRIAVGMDEIEPARQKRNELMATLKDVVGRHFADVETFPSGALAAGTQISPLNDVDVVVTLPNMPDHWAGHPANALDDVRVWLQDDIEAEYECSPHAIKLTYRDEDFTADVVIGVRQTKGILIPHCPDDEPHGWLATDPATHAELVRARKPKGEPALFAQQVRILKHLNRRWREQVADDRKPVSSWHLSALALAVFPKGHHHHHAQDTPTFLDQAAQLMLQPLPDPAEVGDDLVARDPQRASELMREAAAKTRAALTADADERERLLTEVFGDLDEDPAQSSGPGPKQSPPPSAPVPPPPPARPRPKPRPDQGRTYG